MPLNWVGKNIDKENKMAMNDTLASALSKMVNAERVGKDHVTVKTVSKVLKKVLEIAQSNNYIGEVKYEDDGKGGLAHINLIGALNNAGVIKPRFSLKKVDFEKHEKRFLPAKDFGLMIISTPQGIMTHLEAKEKNIGGRLIAYIY